MNDLVVSDMREHRAPVSALPSCFAVPPLAWQAFHAAAARGASPMPSDLVPGALAEASAELERLRRERRPVHVGDVLAWLSGLARTCTLRAVPGDEKVMRRNADAIWEVCQDTHAGCWNDATRRAWLSVNRFWPDPATLLAFMQRFHEALDTSFRICERVVELAGGADEAAIQRDRDEADHQAFLARYGTTDDDLAAEAAAWRAAHAPPSQSSDIAPRLLGETAQAPAAEPAGPQLGGLPRQPRFRPLGPAPVSHTTLRELYRHASVANADNGAARMRLAMLDHAAMRERRAAAAAVHSTA